MSKLLTIFCATAVCFAMADADYYTAILGRNGVLGHIDFAMKEVRNAFRKLNLQSAVIESEPSRKNYNIIEGFKITITREMAEMRPLIDVIIKDANSTFNETQCRSYWVEYEAAERSVLCNIKILIPTTVNAMLAEIKEAINVTNDALTELERFRNRAISCQGYSCYEISKAVGVAYHDFSEKTRSILCRGSRLAEASKIQQVARVKNLYTKYLTIAGSLIMKTLACVNTTHHYS